MPASGVTAS